MGSIRNPKDFWLGLFYVVFGGGAALISRNYQLGSGSNMGPGYFPFYLASTLTLLGLLALGRSFLRSGQAISRIDLRAMVLITAAIVSFGLLLERAGLLIALATCMIIAASASHRFRFEPVPALGLIAFVGLAALVFVKALGLPMPLLGSWFE